MVEQANRFGKAKKDVAAAAKAPPAARKKKSRKAALELNDQAMAADGF